MAVFNLLFTLDCWFDLNIDPTVMQKIYLYEKKLTFSLTMSISFHIGLYLKILQ